MNPLLKLERIKKRFGRIQALDDVSLGFEQGRIYGLAGENGAGKSTLVKLLCGVHAPDDGSIELAGRAFLPASPAEAEEAGISVFHQEIPVCPNLTVAANIFLGATRFFTHWKEMERQCEKWFQEWLGISINPRRLIRDCTVAERQMTLLVRALSREARIVILDEPTTALTPPEAASFFKVIRSLRSQRITFIFISHFLDELMDLSDEIYVLRDGKRVGALEKHEFDAAVLASLIAGRPMQVETNYSSAAFSPSPRLEVQSICRKNAFRDVSFAVRPGEILGITGAQGSGRSEVARALFGAPSPDSGEILIDGSLVQIKKPEDAMAAGIGYVPEDRQQMGLFDDLDVQTNLGILRLAAETNCGFLSRRHLRTLTLEMQQRLRIRLPAPDAPITTLSGGNQQKVLIARWLAMNPAVLIMNEPTRGVDVGAKDEICQLLRSLAQSGCALIVASTDIDEVLRLADRILVMGAGRVSREFQRNEASKTHLIHSIGTA